jgi:hypothetical protein
MAIPSVYPGMTDGPGIGEKIAYVGIGRTGGELIEHVAQVRPFSITCSPCMNAWASRTWTFPLGNGRLANSSHRWS